MTEPAGPSAAPAAPRRADRAFGLLALAGIPGALFTAAATVPMGLAALYALGARLAGNRADPDVARLFQVFLACYAALLSADLLNGGGIGNFQFTAVNYLPLLGAAGVAFTLRRSALGDQAVTLALSMAIWAAVAISLVSALVFGLERPGGLFMNPIPYSLVVCLWGMLLLSFALRAGPRRYLLIATALAAWIPIAVAQTKIVWIAGCVGYAVVILHWGASRERRRGEVLGALALLALASALFLPVAYSRLAEFAGEVDAFVTQGDRSGISFGHRAILAEAAFRAFAHGPLLGYGFVEHVDAALAYVDPAGPSVAHLTHLHNDYATHLVAYGYVGLAFLLAFFATLWWIARNAAGAARRGAAYALLPTVAIYMSAEILLNIEPITGAFAILIGVLMMRPLSAAPPPGRA